jgi:hypothetical protein
MTFGVFQAITLSPPKSTTNQKRYPTNTQGFCLDNQDKTLPAGCNRKIIPCPGELFFSVKQLKNITTWGYINYNF